jgi:hypothetical protein
VKGWGAVSAMVDLRSRCSVACAMGRTLDVGCQRGYVVLRGSGRCS